MSHNNDIVLIDSSSDEDEVQQNAKRFKPDPELNTYSNNKSNNGKFSIAPFQEVSLLLLLLKMRMRTKTPTAIAYNIQLC